MYRFWWTLVRLAVVGLVFVLVDQLKAPLSTHTPTPPHSFSRPVQAGLVTLAFTFLLIFGSVWRFIMIVLGSQGRYLIPVIAAISIFLMLGLSRLLPSF
jgi:hypothetical protein